MKDWDYYQTPVGVELVTYAYRDILSNQMRQAINDAPLTATDRDMKLKSLKADVMAIVVERNKPYHAAVAALKEEFWTDCREELGYQKRLSPKAVAILEQKAWDDGHDMGYSEVFSKLEELVEFADQMIDGFLVKD